MSVAVRPYRKGGWEVDIQWRLPNGRRRRERKRLTVTSKTAARRWGESRERELLVNGQEKSRREVPTLGHARANRQKPGGIAHKEVILRVHLIPQLGTKKLDAIGNEDVQRLKHHLRSKAVRTVNNVLTVLNTMLKKAVEWQVIDQMACTVRLLKVTQGAIDFYDFDEYDSLVTMSASIARRRCGT